MPAHNRRLKAITLTVATISIECQVTEWKLNPPDNVLGDRVWTFCPGGEFYEESDLDEYTLDLTWATDWRAAGLNRYLWANQGAEAAFVLTNHPTTTGEAVRWTGTLYVVAPAVGGSARETEMSEQTFPVKGVPVLTYPTV